MGKKLLKINFAKFLQIQSQTPEAVLSKIGGESCGIVHPLSEPPIIADSRISRIVFLFGLSKSGQFDKSAVLAMNKSLKLQTLRSKVN